MKTLKKGLRNDEKAKNGRFAMQQCVVVQMDVGTHEACSKVSD
jgi:hypothetical protein